ncbi:hypothetical protein DFH06DRAFT_1476201 [Mycena polygramma]|nr:hypothetical protein DFH06DRAFT_1476201 [Mycena polygramma]
MATALEDTLATVSPADDSGPRFPPELYLLVLEHLPSDFDSTACAVSKQWLSISQPRIFSHITLGTPKPRSSKTRCATLYELICESPHIAQYIRHVAIVEGSVVSKEAAAQMTMRWIASDETLPLLLDILLQSSKVQRFQMRLSSDDWLELPLAVQTSVRALISSSSMQDVDFTGFGVVDSSVFKQCRSLKRLKFSEIASLVFEKGVDATQAGQLVLYESLTVLDTISLSHITSWAITSPSFRALRDLRLGFHPLNDVKHVQGMLVHVGATLESLHLQPVYASWPQPAHLLSLSILPALTSLRLSLGISETSNPIPWAAYLLGTLTHNALLHLTIDLRVGWEREPVSNIAWGELDDALCAPQLTASALTFTCFPYKSQIELLNDYNGGRIQTVQWLTEELPRFLPRTTACHGDAFVQQLKFEPTRFFYWPGPVNWQRQNSTGNA